MTVIRGILHGLVLALALLGTSCSPEKGKSIPEKEVLELSTEHVFLGSVAVGEDTCEREVTIKNLSSGVFEVLRVESSCGCMVPDFNPITLAPGQDLKLRMQLIPGAVRGVRQANILIEGSNAKITKIPVSAWFEPESGFMLEKGPATITVSGPDKPATIYFKVYTQRGAADDFVVSCDRESVQLASESSKIGNSGEGSEGLVELKYTATLPSQLLEESRKANFTIQKRDAPQFAATYEITWLNDHGTFAVEPGELFVSAPAETRTAWISASPEVELRLASKPDFLRCSLEREEVEGATVPRWLLTVTSSSESPPGFHQYVLRVEAVDRSDGKVRRAFEVPCSYVRLDGQ